MKAYAVRRKAVNASSDEPYIQYYDFEKRFFFKSSNLRSLSYLTLSIELVYEVMKRYPNELCELCEFEIKEAK